jgi:hypothetical protein
MHVVDANANQTSIGTRAGARAETREAQCEVAIARRDALAGPEKETCTSSAKSARGNQEGWQVICT